MLLAIRERIMGVVGWVILGVLFIAFAFFGLNSYLQTETVNYAAVVNGDEIGLGRLQRSYEALRNRLEEQLGGSIDPAMLDEKLLKQRALTQMINQQLLFQAADAAGFAASNEQVAAQISAIEGFKVGGVFSKERYEEVLGYQGIRPAEYEQSLARDIMISQYTGGISETAAVPQQSLSQAFSLEGQQRRFSYLLLPLATFTAQVAATDEEIEKYYQAHAAVFTSPERVRAQYLELDVATLDTGTEVSAEAIQALYDEQSARYVIPEERHVRHILVQLAADADDQAEAAALEKASTIVARLDAGDAFADVAKEMSDDPGSAASGGDLGFFGRGIMDPVFEEAMFALAAGEVSEPVKTPFGFHIIELVEIKPEVATPLAEVRDELINQLQSEERNDLFYEQSEALANLTFEQPDTLQGAADELALKIMETEWLTAQEGSGIAEHAEVREALFSEDVLDNGNNSAAVEIGPDHIVVLRMLEQQPAALQPLADVREKIEQLVSDEKARALAVTRGAELLASLQAGETTLEAVAAKDSLQLQTTELISRTVSEPAAAVVSAAFAASAPNSDAPVYHGVMSASGDYILIALQEVKAGDFSTLPAAARERIWANLNKLQGTTELAAVLTILRAQASISIPGQAGE